MNSGNNLQDNAIKKRVPWYAYLTLFLTTLFLSGLLTKVEGPLAALDFTNVLGTFGKLGTVAEGSDVVLARNFKGIGGIGVQDGFLLSLTIAPAIILAFGVIELYNDFKGPQAAEKLFSPILKPMLGLPGASAIAIVSSFTSSDAAAGLSRSLYDAGHLSENQLIILTTFMFSAPSIVVNIFAFSAPLFPFIPIPITVAMLVVIVMKFTGAIMCRIYLGFISKDKGEGEGTYDGS